MIAGRGIHVPQLFVMSSSRSSELTRFYFIENPGKHLLGDPTKLGLASSEILLGQFKH